MKSRTGQSERERRLRSRMHFLLRELGVLRGSVLTLKTRCGKPGCRCARGEKHRLLVVEQNRKGKTRMRTIPPGSEEELVGWVRNYREFRRRLEELSEVHWRKLEQRKK